MNRRPMNSAIRVLLAVAVVVTMSATSGWAEAGDPFRMLNYQG